jgi:hypothetical protein
MIRLGTSVAVREQRLLALLRGRSPADLGLHRVVADAQLLGSLELAGLQVGWSEVTGKAPGPEVFALRTAQQAVPADAAFAVAALEAWHHALFGAGAAVFRDVDLAVTDRPAAAPGAFVTSRLALLEHWLAGGSGQELPPTETAALVLARLVEILPFTRGNGRIARLAASHLMVRGGLRPPILVGGDRPRLEACLRAAMALDTEPLTTLLREASERPLDVMIQSLAAAEPAAAPR